MYHKTWRGLTTTIRSAHGQYLHDQYGSHRGSIATLSSSDLDADPDPDLGSLQKLRNQILCWQTKILWAELDFCAKQLSLSGFRIPGLILGKTWADINRNKYIFFFEVFSPQAVSQPTYDWELLETDQKLNAILLFSWQVLATKREHRSQNAPSNGFILMVFSHSVKKQIRAFHAVSKYLTGSCKSW